MEELKLNKEEVEFLIELTTELKTTMENNFPTEQLDKMNKMMEFMISLGMPEDKLLQMKEDAINKMRDTSQVSNIITKLHWLKNELIQ